MSSHEVQAALFLNSINAVGPARFSALIEKFGSSREAVQAGPKAWQNVRLFDPRVVAEIETQYASALESSEKDWIEINKHNVRIFLSYSGIYPKLLAQIAFPPPVLYVLGEDISQQATTVAMVGSRKCSYYGEKMACKISAELVEAGVTVVSGLARGIDTFAHKAAIEAGGKTWAVIGSGLSRIYPPENKSLAKLIEQSGALISEFPMHTFPFQGNFPRRNRIIAGLSLGTVVVEGGEKSGSLITARLAAEEGRDVFAIPGPVTSELSVAPNRLLQSGAAMVQSATDILSELGIKSFHTEDAFRKSDPDSGSAEYEEVLRFLGAEAVQKEILAQRLHKDASQISSLLLEMELRGLIKSISGGGVLKT